MDECALRRYVRKAGFSCDEGECVFWSQLGIDGTPQCAIQYFRLIDTPGAHDLAEWLLTLKERDAIIEALGGKRIGRALLEE